MTYCQHAFLEDDTQGCQGGTYTPSYASYDGKTAHTCWWTYDAVAGTPDDNKRGRNSGSGFNGTKVSKGSGTYGFIYSSNAWMVEPVYLQVTTYQYQYLADTNNHLIAPWPDPPTFQIDGYPDTWKDGGDTVGNYKLLDMCIAQCLSEQGLKGCLMGSGNAVHDDPRTGQCSLGGGQLNKQTQLVTTGNPNDYGFTLTVVAPPPPPPAAPPGYIIDLDGFICPIDDEVRFKCPNKNSGTCNVIFPACRMCGPGGCGFTYDAFFQPPICPENEKYNKQNWQTAILIYSILLQTDETTMSMSVSSEVAHHRSSVLIVIKLHEPLHPPFFFHDGILQTIK